MNSEEVKQALRRDDTHPVSIGRAENRLCHGVQVIVTQDVEPVYALPMLYLYRKEETDSAGAGKFRGGATASMCYVPHDTEGMKYLGETFSMAVQTSQGVSGGHPANTARYEMIRDSNGLEVGRMLEDRSEVDDDLGVFAPKYKTMQGPDDVYFSIWQGGDG